MKKIMFLMFSALCLVACEPYPDYYDHDYDYMRSDKDHRNNGNNSGNNNDSGDNGDDGDNTGSTNTFGITKLYSVVMRRELPYPFKAYVLQISNGQYFYMMRYRLNEDLHVGDVIKFSVYANCPNEIAVINGHDISGDENALPTNPVDAGEYLVASDPIEAEVKNMFLMKIRYSLSFLPLDTWFIETTDGNLIFIKSSKLNVNLSTGDRIVYNVYTLFPNEILALKKL